MAVKVIMPKLGESVVDGTVLKWLKNEGDRISEFESLVEVETAKVVSEIPSPASGVLLKILAPAGSTILVDEAIAWIGEPGEELTDTESDKKPVGEQSAMEYPQVHAPIENVIQRKDLGFISPVVARIAREHQVDLAKIRGTGEGGRITKKDILQYLETIGEPDVQGSTIAAWETPGTGDLFKPTDALYAPTLKVPSQEGSPSVHRDVTAGESTVIPLNATRRAIAEHMILSKQTSAHVTTVMESDLTRVIAHREKIIRDSEQQGIRLTYTPYFLLAAVQALLQFPLVNSSWEAAGLRLYRHIHLGMAVSLGEGGLIVPVIKNAELLSLLGMARAVNDLADRARRKQLKPDEVSGGTFSITNHGIGRSLFATPIINQPQCAILGIGAIYKRPVVVGDAIAIRSMVYLSLTFDHRILDGSTADQFLAAVVDTLENWDPAR